MNCIISSGVAKLEWRAGEMQSSPSLTSRISAISRVTLAAGSTPPWPGFAPCDNLISIILSSERGDVGEFFFREAAVVVAAAEMAGANLPDQVSTMLQMIGAHAAFAGVVREIAELGALVERENGVGRKRAEGERRDVEHGGGIGLGAIRAADRGAEQFAGPDFGRNRMVQPFIVVAVDVVMGAERPLVERLLGALIDDGALVAREGHAVLLVLEKILTKLGADMLEDEADMRGDRVIAQNSVLGLNQIAQAEQEEEGEKAERNGEVKGRLRVMPNQCPEDQGPHSGDSEQDVARCEGQQQMAHEPSLASGPGPVPALPAF